MRQNWVTYGQSPDSPLLLAVATLSNGRLAVAASLTVVFLAVAALTAAAAASGRLPQRLWTAPLVTGTVLLVIAAATRLHVVPPCNVSDDDVRAALTILDEALSAS